MHILIITSEFYDEKSGGIGTYVYNLCKYLILNGHEVDIITDIRGELKCREHIDKMQIHKVPIRGYSFLEIFKWSFEAYILYKKLIKVKKFDVINIHMPTAQLYPCIAFMERKIPTILTLHNSLLSKQTRAVSNYTKLSCRIRDLISCIQSHKIIVLNETLQKDLCRLGISKQKIVCIPNAIDISLFSPNKTNVDLIQNLYGFHLKKTALLFVGRLYPGKGIEHLLEAMRIVNNHTSKNIGLLVVGDGIMKSNLIQEYSDLKNVFFVGNVSNRDDLISIYKMHDLFVYPSEGEGMPTVILEAMAAGLPIISTRIPGIEDIIKENFGVLIEPKNVQLLAEELLSLIDNKEKLHRMGFESLKESKKYDWKIIGKEITKIFDDIKIILEV